MQYVVAIDGHSSCGKSTIAKECAKELGYIYVDTGSMYRAVTLYAIRNNMFNGTTLDSRELISHLPQIEIKFRNNPKTNINEIMLNGEAVEDEIRGITVSSKVSYVASVSEVREAMVEQQQQYSNRGGVVMDGRDIGTVVFPNADLKIFMTASVTIRAQRRFDELSAKGDKITFEEIAKNISDRDYIDENREVSPLTKADDAITLDNSNMTREEQLAWLLAKVATISQ